MCPCFFDGILENIDLILLCYYKRQGKERGENTTFFMGKPVIVAICETVAAPLFFDKNIEK